MPRKGKERAWAWASIKYEKLSDFCFVCGKLGHLWKNCDKRIEFCPAANTKQRYKAHMRAGLVRENKVEFLKGTKKVRYKY